MRSQRTVELTRWMIALVGLAAIIAAYHALAQVNPTTVALTLVLYVLVLAARMGLRYAVLVSLVASIGFNYYFLPPIGTLTIADPENWLALLAFIATSVIGSRLSQAARDEAEHARAQQREVELLLTVSRELLQTENVPQLIAALPAMLLQVSGSSSVALFLLEGDRLYGAGLQSSAGEDLAHLRQLALAIPDVETTPDAAVRIPLRAGVRPRGLLTLADTHMSDEGYRAIGGLVSIALDRAHALEIVAKSEANRESERLRHLILDSITHELRTPLTAIKGAASTLLTNDDVGVEDRQELLTIVDEEADRLNRLIGQAVEMAQIEAREVHMNLVPVSIADLVDRARDTCTWVFTTRQVSVDLPNLPPVSADPEMTGKVLCNLLENAAKYSDEGSPIFITAQQQGGTVQTSVADRGIGIDPDEQDLIFDRLYRSRSHGSAAGGTGMGLAISRAIVESHGGALTVTSQPGHGSVFTFTLPSEEVA